MNYGPKPWHQSNWDFRAALNFIFGGTGAGLLVIVPFSGLAGDALRAEIVLGMALIGVGLISVWFEIGRPLRAINVDISGTLDRAKPVRKDVSVLNSVRVKFNLTGVTAAQGATLIDRFKSR